MGQWGKLSCLLLVVLVSDPPVANGQSQHVPGHRHSQWGPWQGSYPQPVVGSAEGSSRWYPGGAAQPRQLSQQKPIRVRCEESTLVVNVLRDLFRTGRLVKDSDMTLGPQLCPPSSQSTAAMLVFQAGLHECGNSLQMTPDWLIYSTNVTYNPTPSQNSPVIRTNSAVVSIQCYYPRHGNVSSKAINPTWVPFSSTISVEERLSFSLHLMSGDWSSRRTSTVFQLGDVVNIEAAIETGNHEPMTIFVDSCVATLSPDINSNPRYEIIALNGCLLDGKLEDSFSAFRSPRPQPDRLQFMVDAFRFTGTDLSMIYITCNLRVAAPTQAPGPMNKACSFSKTRNTWLPVEGPIGICSCCDTGSCGSLGGQSRRIVHNPSHRGFGKREAALGPHSEQEHGLATLGPLLVIGPENKALAVTPESRPSAEMWVLVVALSSLGLVVISFCVAVNWQYFFKSPSVVQSTQK
ncbi:hypothetical protein FKM82_017534 [Ascaphus truei]